MKNYFENAGKSASGKRDQQKNDKEFIKSRISLIVHVT